MSYLEMKMASFSTYKDNGLHTRAIFLTAAIKFSTVYGDIKNKK